MRVMQDEIFGPLLPIVPYRNLDEALGYVVDHPRPLAMYYFDYDRVRIERVLQDSMATPQAPSRTSASGPPTNDSGDTCKTHAP